MTSNAGRKAVGIVSIVVCKVSCANLERSVAFYEKFGFAVAGPASDTRADWIGDLYGAKGAWLRTQAMTLGDDPRAVRLELLEWSSPEAPVAGPTALGAGAIALRSDDLRADVEALKQKGVQFVSQVVSLPGPKGESLLVNVRDPDGFSIQLYQFVRTVAPTAG